MKDKPEEKPTVELEKPPAWAIGLREEMARGFRDLRSDVETLVADGKSANQRMTKIELRLDAYEQRAAKTSERVHGSSQVDAKHDAAIATLVTDLAAVKEDVGAIKAKPDTAALVLARMSEAAKTPTGQKVLGGLATLALVALSAITLKLQATVAELEKKPAPATTVYVVSPDGGAP